MSHAQAVCTYEWLDQLDAIVLGRVMRRRNHDTDPFSLERPRPQRGDQTHAGKHRFEHFAASVSICSRRGSIRRCRGESREHRDADGADCKRDGRATTSQATQGLWFCETHAFVLNCSWSAQLREYQIAPTHASSSICVFEPLGRGVLLHRVDNGVGHAGADVSSRLLSVAMAVRRD